MPAKSRRPKAPVTHLGITLDPTQPRRDQRACAEALTKSIVEAANEGPVIITMHGSGMICWMTAQGWQTSSFTADGSMRLSTQCCFSNNASRSNAIVSAITSLNHQHWSADIEDDLAYLEPSDRVACRVGLSMQECDAMRESFLRWATWQRRHAAAVTAGQSLHNAHRLACDAQDRGLSEQAFATLLTNTNPIGNDSANC